MICSCGGSIVVRVTARDGETAGCERCQRCVTVTGLLAEVDRLRDEARMYGKPSRTEHVMADPTMGDDLNLAELGALMHACALFVYTASKTRHAPTWRGLRAAGVPVISTWSDEAGPGETADFSDLWSRCIREASTAAALIVYAEDGDVLKGGFVEVGAALGCGVPVFAVGTQAGWTFTNHPLVTKCGSVAEALRLALRTRSVG
jgi:hypothetical protein